MQFFAVILIIAVASVHGQAANDKKEDKLLGSPYGSGGSGSSGYSAPAAPSYAAPAAPSYAAPAAPAYAAPAPSYQPVSIPSPPCPKNYLFSCQPNLQPVPCARGASGGYGSQGAYSQYQPTYALPTGYVY